MEAKRFKRNRRQQAKKLELLIQILSYGQPLLGRCYTSKGRWPTGKYVKGVGYVRGGQAEGM